MTSTVDAMSPGVQRDAAMEWLAWCSRYVDSVVDPLTKPPGMPPIRQPTWEERISLEMRLSTSLKVKGPMHEVSRISDEARGVRVRAAGKRLPRAAQVRAEVRNGLTARKYL